MADADDDAQEYLRYSTDSDNKVHADSDDINHNVRNTVKPVIIKIIVLCKAVTMVQKFHTTSTFNDIKTFVLNSINLPMGSVHFSAHGQVITRQDYDRTLDVY